MAVNTHFAMMDGSQAPQTQDLPSYEDAGWGYYLLHNT